MRYLMHFPGKKFSQGECFHLFLEAFICLLRVET